jgi:hypothetical protein
MEVMYPEFRCYYKRFDIWYSIFDIGDWIMEDRWMAATRHRHPHGLLKVHGEPMLGHFFNAKSAKKQRNLCGRLPFVL